MHVITEWPCDTAVTQRLNVLESFLGSEGSDPLAGLIRPGTVVLADLTDPFLSAPEANGVFQVLLEHFQAPADVVKVVVFDEAHRYMGTEGSTDGLAQDIVRYAREQRHLGLRVLVSTQSPLNLPSELLELVTVFVAHRYQSPEWHHCLCKHLPFEPDHFETIRQLMKGHALVYSSSSEFCNGCLPPMRIRPRITSDLGATIRNVGKEC